MHVGLNLVYLVPGAQGGMETYARELIPELVAVAPEHRFTSFINRDAADSAGPWHDHTGSVVVPMSARSRAQWVDGEQRLLPPLARRAGVDVLHSFASTAPGWGPFRRVVTIHDLIYRTMPEAHPGVRSLGMRVLVPLAAWRSHRIITPSRATADDLTAHLRIDPGRIDVIHEGVGALRRGSPTPEAQLRRQLDAGNRPLVLSVSAKLAHKNLGRLIAALAEFAPAERPLLVLPGYPTPHETELRGQVRQLDLVGDVRFPGWVSPAELEGLYRAASCVVLPTLAEGFGLPVLEAMSRGIAVACSDLPVLREVAATDAVLFDPRSVPAIARAIGRMLGDPALCDRLGAAGRARAAQFSWRRAAAQTIESYGRVSP